MKTTIIANVRVRKQDRSGNTYHDVQLLNIEGQMIAEAVKRYGYGKQYEETAEELAAQALPELNQNFTPIEYQNGFKRSSTKQAIEAGILNIIYIVHTY